MASVFFAASPMLPRVDLNVGTFFAISVSLTGPRLNWNARRVNSRLLNSDIKPLAHLKTGSYLISYMIASQNRNRFQVLEASMTKIAFAFV